MGAIGRCDEVCNDRESAREHWDIIRLSIMSV
jgi:hypothetical protein